MTSLAKKIGLVLLVVALVGWVTTYSKPASKLFRVNVH